MSHEPTLATRAWKIAETHIPHFSGLFAPARNAILTAITAALRSNQKEPQMDTPPIPIDASTGRPNGDHGTAMDAINFALDTSNGLEADDFLRAWREGDLAEYPDFYEWLAAQEGAERSLAA